MFARGPGTPSPGQATHSPRLGQDSSVGGTVRDTWAVRSTPSMFRKTKEFIKGANKLDGDPLANSIEELKKFDAVLVALSQSTISLRASVESLAQAPQSLVDTLDGFFPIEIPGSHHVSRLCSVMATFKALVQSDSVKTPITEAQDIVRTLTEQSGFAHAALKQRDAAYNDLVHYEQKVDGVREQVTKSSPSAKLVEKLHRNEQKKAEVERQFDAAMQQSTETVQAVLSVKWQKTAEALAMLCRFYVAVFGNIAEMAQELSEIERHLTGRPCQDRWTQRAQELTAQAGLGVSNLMTNMRGKFVGPQASMPGSSPWGAAAPPGPWGGPASAPDADAASGVHGGGYGAGGAPSPWGQPPAPVAGGYHPGRGGAPPHPQQAPAAPYEGPGAAHQAAAQQAPMQHSPPVPSRSSSVPPRRSPAGAAEARGTGAPSFQAEPPQVGEQVQVKRNGEWLMGSISQIEKNRLRIQYQVPGKSGMAIKWMDADSGDIQRFAAAAPPPQEHPADDASFGQQPADPWASKGAPQPAAPRPAGGGVRLPQRGSWTPWS